MDKDALLSVGIQSALDPDALFARFDRLAAMQDMTPKELVPHIERVLGDQIADNYAEWVESE